MDDLIAFPHHFFYIAVQRVSCLLLINDGATRRVRNEDRTCFISAAVDEGPALAFDHDAESCDEIDLRANRYDCTNGCDNSYHG